MPQLLEHAVLASVYISHSYHYLMYELYNVRVDKCQCWCKEAQRLIAVTIPWYQISEQNTTVMNALNQFQLKCFWQLLTRLLSWNVSFITSCVLLANIIDKYAVSDMSKCHCLLSLIPCIAVIFEGDHSCFTGIWYWGENMVRCSKGCKDIGW